MERWKNWVQPTRKLNVRLFHCSAAFRVLSTKSQASKISSLVGLWNVSIFFFSLKYFFLFRSLSSAGCISVRESLSFQNNYFGEEAKIIIKLLQTQKKNDLVKCKVFPSNKSGLVQCNVFCDTKKFLFFPRWLCLND